VPNQDVSAVGVSSVSEGGELMGKLTYLELAYNGNYAGRINRIEHWTYTGKVFIVHREQQDVICETEANWIFLLTK
jgi:hypothetical protein